MLDTLSHFTTGFGSFLIWCLMWSIGGIFLIKGIFKLKGTEIMLVGVAAGLIIESWIANVLGHFLEPLTAFWLAAFLTLAAGVLACIPHFRKGARFKELFPFVPWQWITFLVLFYLFFMMARGMSIWDEFKTLPMVSMIASGDIPPHFPYDTSIVLDEHYLRYLIAAQFMRIGDFYPWTSLALLKALTLSLSTVLVVVWVQKITKNLIAGITGGVLHVLGGGTRWLLLILPPSVIDRFDAVINRIGSGLNSGSDLRTALISPWAAQGMAPIPIPFAFTNGLIKPSVLGLGWDNVTFLILIVVILLYERAKDWKELTILGVLLASMALMDEITFAFLSGVLIVIHIVQIVKKDGTQKNEARTKLLLLAAAWVVVFIQGGFFTSIAQTVFNPSYSSYHSFEVSFNFPPRFVDPHLGELILTNPIHLIVLLLECGPLLFVFPFVLKWGWGAYKEKRYVEAAYIGTSLLGLAFCFVQIVSKGINSAVNRVQNDFLEVSLLFAVPVMYTWLQKSGSGRKILVFMLALITIFGGVVVMGTELSAIQQPQLSLFITDMDVRMMNAYWDRLEQDALVLDPNIPRAITIFARSGNSSDDFYAPTDAWQQMVYDPDPYEMADAGYDYLYYDLEYWKTLTTAEQDLLTSDCVIPVNEETDWTGDFRMLVDIAMCR